MVPSYGNLLKCTIPLQVHGDQWLIWLRVDEMQVCIYIFTLPISQHVAYREVLVTIGNHSFPRLPNRLTVFIILRS